MSPTITRKRRGRGDRRGHVYRCLDADGAVLYVGCVALRSPTLRFNEHRRRSPWWPSVAEIELITVRGAPAYVFEREYINRDRPVHNRQHNPAWQFDGRRYIPTEFWIANGELARPFGAVTVPHRAPPSLRTAAESRTPPAGGL